MRKSMLFLSLVAALAAMAQNVQKVEKYLDKGDTFLSDRLQMHWRTHATQQYMRGEAYSHCGGDSAAYPTLQIDGARGHVSNYMRPSIDSLPPRQEDPRGMWLRNKTLPGNPYEWVPIQRTGRIIGSINQEIVGIAYDAARMFDRECAAGKVTPRGEGCARMAYNVLKTYMLGVLHTRMPIDLNHGHMQTLYGLQTQEVIHEDVVTQLCGTYRILRDREWIRDSVLRQDIEDAFRHWADIIVANGVPHNNWNFMQARFIFNIGRILRPNAAYADGKGKEHYFAIIETGKSIRQWSLKAIAEYGYDMDNGIWCECPGYSQVVLGDLAEFVRLYREELGRDLTEQIPVIPLAARTNVEYLFPDSMTIGFGDTHPARLRTDIYRKLGIDLSALHPSRTFSAPKTSWLIQRTGMKPMQSLAFALNASDGNHMHANGISLELFARGQRLAPDAGIGYSLYSGDDYKEWYSQFPAHNTVCVNGVSAYPVMQSHHPFHIIANAECEAGHGATAQYAIVRMTEPETFAEQERCVAMISMKEDDGRGYFVDIFRSRQPEGGSRQFHDYFYHNMGQAMTCRDSRGAVLAMTPTEELAFAGGHLNAYSYLFDKRSVKSADDAVMTYTITPESEDYLKSVAPQERGPITMTHYVKGESGRTLFQCLAPTTEGLSRMSNMPYDIKSTPTLTYVARQEGEAWQRPFVNVFVPSGAGVDNSVVKVEYPEVALCGKGEVSAVAILVTHRDGARDLIVSTDCDDAKVKVLGKTFSGRFNAVRMK
ncbi:MAG: heparinase II/III family protein [Bacteroides sp.]